MPDTVDRPGRPQTLRIAAAFAAICLLPSTTWIAIKTGLDGAPPLEGAGLRFLVAAACMFALRALTGLELALPRRSWTHLVVIATLIFAVPYALIYAAETRLTSGLTAVLFGSMPLFVVLIANWSRPREPATFAKVAGVCVGMVGLAIVFRGALDISSGTRDVMAMLGVVIAALASGLGQVRARARPSLVPISLLVAWASLVSGVALVLVATSMDGFSFTADTQTVGSVMYLGTTAALGFWSMFWLLGHVGAVFVSLHALIVPLLALLWGAAFYGEPVTLALAIGATVVCGGIALVTGGLPRKPVGAGAPVATQSADRVAP